MNDFYDDKLASIYDLMYPDIGDSRTIAQYILANAPGKTILEMGVGTGRLALPLVEAGFTVSGLDNSESMLDILRQKDRDNSVRVQVADFGRDTLQDQKYDTCLLACNTIYSVLDMEAQLRIFQNAHLALNDDGIFVVEAFNPLWLLRKGSEFMQMRPLDADKTLIEQYHIFPTQQQVTVDNIVVGTSAAQSVNLRFRHIIRYIHPFEMDVLACAAGFELKERYGSFSKQPYSENSTRIVSTYWKCD